MKFHIGFSAVLHILLSVTVSSSTLKHTQKEHDQATRLNAKLQYEFKDFYPRPSSMDEFRRQRLYPVRDIDELVITQISSFIDLALSFNLPFFGFRYKYVWVHKDGYLSFSNGLIEYIWPVQFPIKHLHRFENDPSLIAPWFSMQEIPDSIKESGIYARTVTIDKESDEMLRERLILDFREGMIGATDFSPTHAIIVTWRNVTFPNRRSIDENHTKTNTYQVVLATDEVRTYAMFNYDNIEWITYMDPYEGLKGANPFVGFNAGNRTRAFELRPYSQSPIIALLERGGYGNNIKGRWIFQIDEEVLPGSCVNKELDPTYTSHGRLTFFPRRGNMLGGTIVNVTGPCFGSYGEDDQNTVAVCRFDNVDVTAVYRDINHVSCVQPFLPHHGYVNLSVSVNHGPFGFIGRYYIQPPEMGEEDIVVRGDADRSEYPTSMVIIWEPKSLAWNGKGKASLYLWGYREPSIHKNARLTYIDSLEEDTIAVEKAFHELDPVELQKRNNYDDIDMEFGFLSMTVSSSEKAQSPVIWSRPMPLAWYFRPQWERKYGDQWKNHFCKNWTEADKELISQPTSSELSCPCTLEQAKLDVGRFIPDLWCNHLKKHCETFHLGAQYCAINGRPTSDGHGLLCCYDHDGELMKETDTIYASRPSKSHIFGSHPYSARRNVPALSHWQVDKMPFFFCCKWRGERNDELCQLYNERRKSDYCLSYNPPGIASVFGDPHFLTFDGLNYTFNGKGEFVLVRASESNVKIDVQGRFEEPFHPIERYDGINATKLTAVAARVGESSVVEFRLRPKEARWRYHLFLIVDGEYYYLDNDIVLFKNVTVYQPSGMYNMSHMIALFHSGVGVEVKNNGGNLAVNVYLPLSYFEETSGLLGNWSNNMTDDFTLPDGKIAMYPLSDEDIHKTFGMKWRVTEADSQTVGRSLFLHDAIPFDQFDDVHFKPRFMHEIIHNARGQFAQVCSNSQTCIYDLVMTADKKFAAATKNHEATAYALKVLAERKEIRCPPVPVPNGRKSNIGTRPGNVVLITCDESYRLVGDAKLICKNNGTWEGKPPKCLKRVFKDFYPRPSTVKEFRRQLLYPVKEENYIWEMKEVMPYLLQKNLPLFGSTFNKFYIRGNGIIGFLGLEDSILHTHSPRKMIDRYREEDISTMSPLFSRDDSFSCSTEACGLYVEEINVKQENDTMLKERLLLDFKEGMVGSEDFNPTFAISITWRNSSSGTKSNKTNTFQVVLATDEVNTYAMFNYDNIQSIDFLEENGERKVANFVGFNGPRRTRIFELEPYSQSTDIVLLREHGYGNQLNGRWFFKVDDDIQMGSCIDRKIKQNSKQKYPLTFYPHSGVMLGGTFVIVTGPCFHPNDVISCKFGTVETNAVYLDNNRVMCAQPQLFHYGYIDLTLSINGERTRFVGKYYINPAGITKADISVYNRAEMSEYPTSMVIRWNPKLFGDSENETASLNLWGYREIANEEPKLTFIDTLSQVSVSAHNSSYEFDPVELQKRNNYDEIEMEFGFLSLNATDSNTSLSRVIWSTPMPLAWYFRPQWEKKFEDGWKQHFCDEWAERGEELFPSDHVLISCPCTLEQAEADRGRFFADASCNYIEKNCDILHKRAHHCVRYGRPLNDGSGQLCCYDHSGELIRSADSMYSGRPSRSNFYGKPPYYKALMVPSLSHWYHDIIPFFFCCKWSSENSDSCALFEEKRKSGDCVSYKAPGVGFVYGDPHFITFDGTEYTFNGKGEFVLVRVENPRYSLNIQGRFEEVFYYVREGQKALNATQLTALVVKDGSSSLVEFRLHPHPQRSRYKISVLVDKEYINFRNDVPRVQSFRGITMYQPVGIYNMSHVVALFDSGAGVELTTNNGNMAATIYLPRGYMNITSGLLGKWSKRKSDDFMLPNGTILNFHNVSTKSIHESFGMAWRLTQLAEENKGHSLFYHDSDAIYDDPQFRPIYELPKNVSGYPSTKEMTKICGASTTCLFDLVATNDSQFASATKQHVVKALLLRQTTMKLVTRCPALPRPRNGRKSSQTYTIGAVVRFACDRGYSLVGDSARTCQEDGTWTGNDATCKRKE